MLLLVVERRGEGAMAPSSHVEKLVILPLVDHLTLSLALLLMMPVPMLVPLVPTPLLLPYPQCLGLRSLMLLLLLVVEWRGWCCCVQQACHVVPHGSLHQE